MEKIRIITDSTSEIQAPYPSNLTVLPLSIRFGQEEYLDGVTISHREFFEKLAECKDLPTTSLIPPVAFEEAFDKAEANGETVIAIIISSKLSGTYQSALLAADDRPNIHVVDSMNATIGLQILVKYAMRLVDQGLSSKEIVDKLEESKSHARLMGIPETLEYLRRGGRISNTIAFVGEALSIKPVLALKDGGIGMLGKARGSKNAVGFMVREAEKNGGIDFSKPFCLGYTGLTDKNLHTFIEETASLWKNAPMPLSVSSVGATIGTHIGPNAVLMAYFDNQ